MGRKMQKNLKTCKNIGLKNEQYIIRKRYLSEDEDFGITLSNRAGLMDNAEFKIKPLEKSLNNPCFIPSYTFFFRLSGRCINVPS